MDATDSLIVQHLAVNGRASWAELGVRLGLSRQTVADRVEKLEQARVITGYQAVINSEAVGADLTAFIGVTLDRPEHSAPFLDAVRAWDEVLECHHVAGDDSYLLKVRTRGTQGLERFISYRLKELHGVVRTRTTVVLSTAKETLLPPLMGGERP